MKLQATAPDHSLAVMIKTCKGKATAVIEMPTAGKTFAISDANTANNSCACH